MRANLLQRPIPMKVELKVKVVEAKELQTKPNNTSRANGTQQYPNPYNHACKKGTAIDCQCTR